jgi:3' terminal RNA ribose 2'-O-methyltransferase Hen1
VLLTITTSHQPATDLGFLLHKHPDRVQTFDVVAGKAHVLYPEATEQRCTAALMLEIDPIALVRGRGRKDEGFALGQYVNDRPYAASSMLAVALGKVFRTAMSGRCDSRPGLADTALPLMIRVPTLPCRGGAELAARLFEPLGWQVEAAGIPLDETVPEWGASRYVDLTLTGTLRLADALNHLYVLMPVLDDAKHYWVSPDEIEKLIRAGDGWLAGHPDKALISRRYLAHRGGYVRSALGRLAEVDDTEPEELDNAVEDTPEEERPVPLVRQRHGAVLAALRSCGARRVADLGCGEGSLVGELLADPAFTEVVATDVSVRALEIAARKLRLDTMPERKKERLRLFQSSLSYRDERLSDLDAAVLMEVIEHVDPPRLEALERVVFGESKPRTVLVTTPNAEYNVRYETLPTGRFRHRDHRFEWDRGEFRSWAAKTAEVWGYQVRHLPVGTDDPEVGSPTQLAVFTRAEVTV